MNTNNREQINLSELIKNLKEKDQNYANLSKRLQFIYWALLPIYAIMSVVHFLDGSSRNEILGSVCFLFSMLIFALLFNYYSKEYKTVNYSEPTLVMLKKAAYRYQPYRLRAIWAFLGLFFMDMGLVFSDRWENATRVHLCFLSAASIGIIIGLIVWRIKYKPLRDDIQLMIKDLES